MNSAKTNKFQGGPKPISNFLGCAFRILPFALHTLRGGRSEGAESMIFISIFFDQKKGWPPQSRGEEGKSREGGKSEEGGGVTIEGRMGWEYSINILEGQEGWE